MTPKNTITRKESILIQSIVERAKHIAQRAGVPFDTMSTIMDLEACHSNGCRLNLYKLRDADDFNLAHDVFGIIIHLDRNTGKLKDFFLPRFAVGN